MSDSEEPTIADLQRQLAVLNSRFCDAQSHSRVREEKLRKECADLERQKAGLRTHVIALDTFIRKLSLVHSQLTAVPNYRLARADIEEIVKVVTAL
jgi:hypothetical protein